MMKKILIGLDGSVDGMNAADEAYRLGFLSPPAQVTLLGALHINRLTVHGLFGLSEEEAERRRDVFRDKHLTSYRQVLEERGVQVTADVVEDDSPAEAIARVAERDGHDLVVLGRQGLGSLKRMFVGSVTSKVLHLCERPVLVVPHGATSAASDKEKVIVAPTDFSPGSEAGLELAAQLAKAWSARLKLVHCSPFSELLSDGYAAGAFAKSPTLLKFRDEYFMRSREQLGQMVERYQSQGIKVESLLPTTSALTDRDTSTAIGIVDTARFSNAALIVMASHSRVGLPRMWFGSVARRVLEQSDRPVLLARRR